MLLEKLKTYSQSDIYPFHMPGHKRRMTLPSDAYGLDITEVEGFDNLHRAEGILAGEQQRFADFAGAKDSFFLVNGSTCGILAAISAAVPRGGRILIARNSHKSAYHALMLRQLSACYVYPKISMFDIQDMILAEDIERIISAHNDIEAVYITSPTYDGVVSDIKKNSSDRPCAWKGAHRGRGARRSLWLSSVFPGICGEAGSRCGDPEHSQDASRIHTECRTAPVQ